MKPSRRKTRELKLKACDHCTHANKAKIRQGRDYCKAIAKPEIVNGHCEQFRQIEARG